MQIQFPFRRLSAAPAQSAFSGVKVALYRVVVDIGASSNGSLKYALVDAQGKVVGQSETPILLCPKAGYESKKAFERRIQQTLQTKVKIPRNAKVEKVVFLMPGIIKNTDKVDVIHNIKLNNGTSAQNVIALNLIPDTWKTKNPQLEAFLGNDMLGAGAVVVEAIERLPKRYRQLGSPMRACVVGGGLGTCNFIVEEQGIRVIPSEGQHVHLEHKPKANTTERMVAVPGAMRKFGETIGLKGEALEAFVASGAFPLVTAFSNKLTTDLKARIKKLKDMELVKITNNKVHLTNVTAKAHTAAAFAAVEQMAAGLSIEFSKVVFNEGTLLAISGAALEKGVYPFLKRRFRQLATHFKQFFLKPKKHESGFDLFARLIKEIAFTSGENFARGFSKGVQILPVPIANNTQAASTLARSHYHKGLGPRSGVQFTAPELSYKAAVRVITRNKTRIKPV